MPTYAVHTRPRLRLARRLAGAVALFAAVPGEVCAAEEAAVSFEAVYTADVLVPLRGATAGGRYLDNLDVVLDVDLERVAGWRGAKLHLYGLNNSGAQPSAVLGTLAGVDNIEVTRARARLYEAWIEQGIGPATVLAGLYDLNSEFYATPASDLLIAPPFGIGSELAATGANGPSIFPSTALAVRARLELGETGYVQAAALNAEAFTLGDPGGVRTDFDGGVLTIAEAGVGTDSRLAVGAWRYSEPTDDLRRTQADGSPAEARAKGAYVLAEHRIGGPVTLFARGGLSDGDTTPFRGSWQAGVFVSPAFAGRPDSAFSLGAHQGILSRKFRLYGADEGRDIGPLESGLEATYSDRIAPRLTLQPNLQYVHRPGGDRDVRDVVVGGLRVILDLAP